MKLTHGCMHSLLNYDEQLKCKLCSSIKGIAGWVGARVPHASLFQLSLKHPRKSEPEAGTGAAQAGERCAFHAPAYLPRAVSHVTALMHGMQPAKRCAA